MLIFEKHKNVSYLYPPEIYFACPVIPKLGSISCHRYHKINMQRFCDDLANISFMLSPASAAVDLYDQYIHGLGCLLDIHAPLICGRIKKKTASWMSDSYCRAKSIWCQFECMWYKDRSQLNITRQ